MQVAPPTQGMLELQALPVILLQLPALEQNAPPLQSALVVQAAPPVIVTIGAGVHVASSVWLCAEHTAKPTLVPFGTSAFQLRSFQSGKVVPLPPVQPT